MNELSIVINRGRVTAVPQNCLSREGGNPVAFTSNEVSNLLDTRLRGYDILPFYVSIQLITLYALQ